MSDFIKYDIELEKGVIRFIEPMEHDKAPAFTFTFDTILIPFEYCKIIEVSRFLGTKCELMIKEQRVAIFSIKSGEADKVANFLHKCVIEFNKVTGEKVSPCRGIRQYIY